MTGTNRTDAATNLLASEAWHSEGSAPAAGDEPDDAKHPQSPNRVRADSGAAWWLIPAQEPRCQQDAHSL
jgi:hypothetical protein